ncbi:uncharacterized protein ACRADG_009712 [Cochliomyia hominivorax]
MMSIENKLKLLWNNANILNSNYQTQRLLKSYYINMCRRLTKDIQIAKEKFVPSQMCPYCGCFWNDVQFGLKLVTKRLQNSSKNKKLIDGLKQNDYGTEKRLTKRQKNRAKWLQKKVSNHLEIKCFQCKHKSLLKMENQKQQDFINEKTECKAETPKLSLKKANNLKNLKKEGIDNKSTKGSKKNIGLSSKKMSKTQKQNSLLQLASLLKKQSNNSRLNCVQNRLQSFLK